MALVQPVIRGAQEAQAERKPLDQVLGTVTSVNAAEKTYTVKEDKTGTEYTISAAEVRRFLKVLPGEKDLKKAQPMDASGITVGDRLMARGQKDAAGAPKMDARIILVMTAGELQQKHQAELEDWQKRGSRGTITSLDEANHQVVLSERGPSGAKTVTLIATPSTQFVRYSPQSVKFADAKPSSFAELRVGDQLRVLGTASEDGSKVTAEQIISGSFKTIGATVVSVAADGKSIVVTDLQTKKPVTVSISDDSSLRRLPQQMAGFLAARLNGGGRPAGAPGGSGGERTGNADHRTPNGPGGPASPGGAGGPEGAPGARPGGGMGRGMGGDLSQMIERLPKISISDLKPGDAVVVSGGAGDDASHLSASNIIAGVEPLFVSAPPRAGGQSAALGMWNLDVSAPGQ